MQEAFPPLDNLPSISALELHEILIRSHASANTGRKRFIDALRALHDTELYLQLGFPNIAAYGEATFRYSSSRTHEFIQVSRALLGLPGITAAFESGAISFHLAARLSEVATGETEHEWLAFLEGRRVRAVVLELERAKETKRDKPRRGSFGLPGLPVKVVFTLSPEEHAIYEKALEKVRVEVAPKLGDEHLDQKDALLVLLRRVLETGAMTAGREETGLSPFTIVVHQCPECARGALQTRDGRVELERRTLERIERHAERVVPEETAPRSRDPISPGGRDRPNSTVLRMAVCQRDGGCCANPFCHRPVTDDGQAHHIKARSLGGRTALWNEAWLCPLCHALVHAGKLVIEGDPATELVFRATAASVTNALRQELAALRAIPEVRTVTVSRGHSGDAESREDLRAAEEALQKLGFTGKEARRRLELVAQRHHGTVLASPGDLVKAALRV